MRHPPKWYTEQQVGHADLFDLTNLDDPRTSSSSTGCSSSSSPELTASPLGDLMNKLPPEVLAEIFFWCTPTVDDQDSCDVQAALILSQVCRHWRSITLSSPQLWTYTKVRVMQEELHPALDLMALYLGRSKSLPVFIDVDFIDMFSYYRPVLVIFQQIVNKAREFRSADLIADSFLATHLESSSTEDRPIREEWYFWSGRPALPSPSTENRQGSYVQSANTPAAAQSVESLVTIRALRVAVGSFVLEPYLPWASSLTFLIIRDLHDFTNLTVIEAARILSSFPLLVHCSLHIDFEPAEPHLLETGSVRLEYLKSFSLSWADWVDTGPLFDALSVPSLRELELVGRLPDTDTGGEWLHLVEFLRRNNPPISHVILEQIDCFHIAFLSALPLTPTLEGLWLEDCLLDDSTIRGLLPTLTTSLKTLVILDCYAFDIGALIEVLKDRQGDKRVRVYVDGCGDVTAAHIEMIRDMGLDHLEIGPSSMPSDLNFDEAIEKRLEFIAAS